MKLSREVKKQITIPQYYRYKGLPFPEKVEKEGGLFSCQIHGPDLNPSAFYNRREGTMYCFACGFSGDVLAVIKELEGLTSFREVLSFIYITFRIDPSETIIEEDGEADYKDKFRQSIIAEFEPFLWEYIDLTQDFSVLEDVSDLYSIEDNTKFYKAISQFKEKLNANRI